MAIADETRREILDLLGQTGPLQAGQIAGRFSKVSRPGISRHLRVLRECGVVDATKIGKAQIYTLNPKPLNDMREGWLATFSDVQTSSLKALREIVEGDDRF